MNDPLRIQGNRPVQGSSQPAANPQQTAPAGSTSFADALKQVQDLRFSKHAQNRLQSRDIQLSDDSVNRLANAVEKADKKGGKSSLVLVDDLAFIVNVRERLVVTALDAEHRGEGVFTQIDTVVFADPSEENRSSIDIQG